MLNRVFRSPLPAVIGIALFLAASTYLATTLSSELLPQEDTGILNANVSAPEGTGYAEMDRYMLQANGKIQQLTEDGSVRAIIQRTPGGNGPSDDYNSGSFTIFLRPWEERSQTTQDVIGDVNKLLGQMPALRGNATVRTSLGRGRGQPINFVLAGATYEELARARDRIIAAAADNPGIINLDSDYKATKPQLRIVVDTARAGDLGVSVASVSEALQSLLGSRRVTTFVDRGEEYRVIVQAEAGARATEASLASIYVRNRSGGLVPLTNLIRTEETAGARDLGRYNKLRAITLQGAVAPDYSLGQALAFLEAEAAKSPEVIAVGYRGESQAFKEAGSSIWLVFLLTILVVYLLLAAQFESFVHPAVIITTVPLALAGGIVGLAVMGQTLNIYSQIGIVMLVGLAAKNGILIVEFANQLRDAGAEHRRRHPRGVGKTPAPDPDDLHRDGCRRHAADAGERGRRRCTAGDRRGGRLGRLYRDADYPAPDTPAVRSADPAHRLPQPRRASSRATARDACPGTGGIDFVTLHDDGGRADRSVGPSPRNSGLAELRIDEDFNLVTDRPDQGREAEVGALEAGGAGEADHLAASTDADQLCVDGDRAGLTHEGEVARYPALVVASPLDGGGDELGLGELTGLEEFVADQLVGEVRHRRLQAGHVDRD